MRAAQQEPENAFRRVLSTRAETHAPCKRDLVGSSFARAPVRRLSAQAPCPTGVRASFRLASLQHREALQPLDGENATMRLTDFCHSKDDVYPYLARSRFAPQLALRGRLVEFGLRGAGPGTSVLHGTRGRFGGSDRSSFSWAFSSHARPRTEPLTLLSQPLVGDAGIDRCAPLEGPPRPPFSAPS